MADESTKPKTHIRTLKLKLKVVGDDPKTSWKRLRQTSNDTWRAANWIADGQFMNDQLVRRLYARLKVDSKDPAAVQKVEDDFKAVFGTKRQATTERDIKQQFPDLPPCVTNTLNQFVVASYTKEKPDMLAGNRSLRTYRKGLPIPTSRASVDFSAQDGRHIVSWKVQRGEQIQFEVFYGRDKAGNERTIGLIIATERDYGAPSIQLNEKGLFLLLPVKEPAQDATLDPKRVVGVDLGLAVPAYAAVSDGPARRPMGSAEDFLKTRLQMQSRRRRLQRSLVAVHGGNGRQRKMKAMDRLSEKERHFARTYNHMISRRLVDFALQVGAGQINMELLEGFGRDEQQAFVLRNWSFFELQQLIGEKAARVGIKVRHVDPYHTSQICSECGNWAQGQRDGRDFVCQNCGLKLDADYNAAVNISRSTKYVQRKEQCRAYIERQTTTTESDDIEKSETDSAGPTAEG